MYEYCVKLAPENKRPYLVKEKEIPYLDAKGMNKPDSIVKMMETVYDLGAMAEEFVYMLTMNTKCDITGVFQIGHGVSSACIARAREVFCRALLAGAERIVLAHNHPTGDPTPSRNDMALTEQMVKAGALLGIEVVDHIVIADGAWLSIRDRFPDWLKPQGN